MVARLVAETFRDDAVDAETRLLRTEADHRIANNLALVAGLVRIQARALPDAGLLRAGDVRLMLQEVSLRIEAVGELHKVLARGGAGDSVDLADYLARVAKTAMASLALEGQTALSLQLAPAHVPARQAGAVGLIVEEAIANALKYSHPTGVKGEVSVTCGRDAQHAVVVEVADDGVGLPENYDASSNASLGMTLQKSLAEQIGARLEWDGSGIGLRVRVTLPAPFASAVDPARASS